MKPKLKIYIRSRLWELKKRLTYTQLIYLLALVVGIGSGLAAVLLKNTIILVEHYLTGWFDANTGSLFYLAYPAIGILITILIVRFFVKDDLSHGITQILYAISRKGSRIKQSKTYSYIITSPFTIGFGGSVGAETPIVVTGSAIGSSLGQFLRLNYKQITLLLGCGVAGGLAGIFKAPLAGIVFTLEVLMLDLTLASIVPLLISSVTATGISYLFLGQNTAYMHATEQFVLSATPYYVLLGIFCGFVALYFTHTTLFIGRLMGKVTSTYKRWLIGAGALGLLIFLIPPLYGEGYHILSGLLVKKSDIIFENSIFYSFKDSGWFIIVYLLFILAFKVVAMSLTTTSGGIGGTAGPTLFMGGIAGFFVARTINLLNITDLHEANFTLVGMGGMFAAIFYAPLTGIFLIAEVTGGYTLFMPLIITSVVSFVTVRIFEPHPVFAKRLALAGELVTHNKDKTALTLLDIEELIENDFNAVHPGDTLGTMVKVISTSRRNLFPVLDKDGKIEGIVLLDDIRELIFKPNLYTVRHVHDFMTYPPAIAVITESTESIINKFERTGAWNLPIMDEEGYYLGFLSKSRILSAYRELLKEFSDE